MNYMATLPPCGKMHELVGGAQPSPLIIHHRLHAPRLAALRGNKPLRNSSGPYGGPVMHAWFTGAEIIPFRRPKVVPAKLLGNSAERVREARL